MEESNKETSIYIFEYQKFIDELDSFSNSAKKIDDFYERKKIESFKYSAQVSAILENYSEKSNIISFTEWSRLHIQTHNDIINYNNAMEENTNLKLIYAELSNEINNLKNTLFENKVNIIYLNTFYS